jgi:hypothetical protein
MFNVMVDQQNNHLTIHNNIPVFTYCHIQNVIK